jgi:hypothetical protein
MNHTARQWHPLNDFKHLYGVWWNCRHHNHAIQRQEEHRARVDGQATARHLHGRTAHTVRCATVNVSAESAGAVAGNVFLESLTTRTRHHKDKWPTRTT